MPNVFDVSPVLSNPAAEFTGETGPANFVAFNRQIQDQAGNANQIVGSVALFSTLVRYMNPVIVGTTAAVWSVMGITT